MRVFFTNVGALLSLVDEVLRVLYFIENVEILVEEIKAKFTIQKQTVRRV